MALPDDESANEKAVSFEEAKKAQGALLDNSARLSAQGFGRPVTTAELYKELAAAQGEEAHGIVPIALDDSHFCAIGKIVVNWAALELMIDSAIWQIAEIPDDLGASLTAQVGTFDGKVRALGAVLTVRGGFDNIISALNKFSGNESRGLLDVRNRVVHDGWVGDLKTGTPHRLTAPSAKSNGLTALLNRHSQSGSG
jgi:hypothetical protein